MTEALHAPGPVGGSSATRSEFPRVLFVTSATFNRSNGGGVTFSNLFSGWPIDRLASVHNDAVPTSDDVCRQYYRVGPQELRRWWPFESLARAVGSGPIATTPAGRQADAPSSMRVSMLRLKDRIFGTGVPETARLSPALIRFIDDFRPEVLYGGLGGQGIVDLTEMIRIRWRLPLVLHLMDDWRDGIYGDGWLSGWQRNRLKRRIAHLMQVAAARLSICDAMSDRMARDYGVPFIAFQNGVDTARYAALGLKDQAPKAQPRLVYAGSLLPFAQGESVVDVARAVAALAADGVPLTFEIYAPPETVVRYRAELDLGPAVRVLPPLPIWEDYYRNLVSADLLLLPVNFDASSKKFIGYSMPTKIPEYMLSGTPVLVYGPPDLAQVDYAAREGWGMVVDERSQARLVDALRRLLTDTALRRRYTERAREVAFARHDLQTVRGNFQAVLKAAAR